MLEEIRAEAVRIGNKTGLEIEIQQLNSRDTYDYTITNPAAKEIESLSYSWSGNAGTFEQTWRFLHGIEIAASLLMPERTR